MLTNTGTYVGAKFSGVTLDAIEQLQRDLKVPFPVPREKLHSTILYSRKPVDYIPNSGSFKLSNQGKLDTFVSQSGKRCLVLKYESEYLQQRHDYGMIIGGTHDYPEYTPHITLSYDIGELKISGEYEVPIILDYEYVEPLDLDWTDKL
ncbi:RNA ligase [Proteus phage phiP4-3]|uniref:Anti-CBASS protein Acb1 n=1 Tax=Proteus phage phiP4-3 TaxID=2065203 RepID=A0A2I6PFH8_9CAUD|nr:RNA ligase [Proteus phage phiP4-3]AUM58489.1 hypothetical protein phiP43_131 [Proteus phage phiP4-3]